MPDGTNKVTTTTTTIHIRSSHIRFYSPYDSTGNEDIINNINISATDVYFRSSYTLYDVTYQSVHHIRCHISISSSHTIELNWIETGTCIASFIQSPQRRSAASHIVSNKCVFSNFLKTGKVKVPSLRSIGRLFQATGPATEKPRPPIVTVLVDGMRRSPAAAELNWERPTWEETGTQNSDR